ncbi:MAG: PelD GGDEF domain-containing protein [Campylobacterota bacterium]|nr:PelD GGDEF domain-containing protein [Campylobacterota bacterium]
MLLTNKVRFYLAKFSYFETIAIMGIYLIVGYFIDPTDICMIKNGITFIIIILAMITLFHGAGNGLVAIVIIGTFMKITYPEFDYSTFLKASVLVLIFGEFHYYWQRTIDKYMTESKFTELKLAELGKAFYMLKISHDQLEKSYVTKPMSLRNSIRLIKENYTETNKKDSYSDFLILLQKTLHIEEVYLGEVNKKLKLDIVASTKDKKHFNHDDIMIEVALEKAMPIYVSSDEVYNDSDYLAVIPALSNDTIVGMLIIEKMPFMSFNKDTLIILAILVTYLFEELKKLKVLNKLSDFFYHFQENFRFEMYRLSEMNRKFSIESSVLVFNISSDLLKHQMLNCIGNNLRSLDVMSSYSNDEKHFIAVLFPFADKSSTVNFVNRCYTILDLDENSSDIRHSTFDISQKALIEESTGHKA